MARLNILRYPDARLHKVAAPVTVFDDSLKRLVDPRRFNGAALLGLRGLVFKSHGSADAFAFEGALNRAYDAARNCLLDRVHDQIQETLQAMPPGLTAEESANSGDAALAA